MKINSKLIISIFALGLCSVLIILLSTSKSQTNANVAIENAVKKNNDSASDYRQFVRNQYQVYAIEMPSSMTFAGEKVPKMNIDIKERLDREFHVNTYWHSQTFLFYKRSGRWFPIIEQILKQEGVPEDFKYLCLIESGLDNVVSPSGASGFWQFMKKTGLDYGLEINEHVDERFQLEKATKAACEYLRAAKEQFGTWTLAAASYNMGRTGLNNRLIAQKVNSYYDLHLNNETSRYVMRIIAAKYILSEPYYYGFNLREKDIYQPYLIKKILVTQNILDLYNFASKNNTNYRTLKILNPWIKGSKLLVTKGETYEISLPKLGRQLQEGVQESKHD